MLVNWRRSPSISCFISPDDLRRLRRDTLIFNEFFLSASLTDLVILFKNNALVVFHRSFVCGTLGSNSFTPFSSYSSIDRSISGCSSARRRRLRCLPERTIQALLHGPAPSSHSGGHG